MFFFWTGSDEYISHGSDPDMFFFKPDPDLDAYGSQASDSGPYKINQDPQHCL